MSFAPQPARDATNRVAHLLPTPRGDARMPAPRHAQAAPEPARRGTTSPPPVSQTAVSQADGEA